MIGDAIITEERFLSGLTLEQFAEGMKENKEIFAGNLTKVDLHEGDWARLAQVNKPANVLVIAEDWCGDVLRYIPVLAKLAEKADQWRVRVFYRDANPDLIEHYLKDGEHKAIPVVVFFDADWNQIGYYQERPAEVYVEEATAKALFANEHQDVPDAGLAYADMSQETKDLYAPFMKNFRAERISDWHELFVDNILELAEGAASARV